MPKNAYTYNFYRERGGVPGHTLRSKLKSLSTLVLLPYPYPEQNRAAHYPSTERNRHPKLQPAVLLSTIPERFPREWRRISPTAVLHEFHLHKISLHTPTGWRLLLLLVGFGNGDDYETLVKSRFDSQLCPPGSGATFRGKVCAEVRGCVCWESFTNLLLINED